VSGVAQLHAGGIPVREACAAIELPPASYYRARRPRREPRPRGPKTSPRALAPAERRAVLEQLRSERFVDRSPHQVYTTLLDDDELYLCSPRTMYRILEAEHELRERRNQCRLPHHTKPQLVARGPNQAWSWDITKLLTCTKGVYLYLYILLDLFSRYIVGWMLAGRESGHLAARLIRETCTKEGIVPGTLTIHTDRGSAPTAKVVSQLYVELDITRSLSRPRVSNDNPFSEALFKTLQYAPGAPDRFAGLEHGRTWASSLVDYYNHHHRHSGLCYLTPAMVHFGRAKRVLAQRQRLLEDAYARRPERFPNGRPKHPAPPAEVWINPPEDRALVVAEPPLPPDETAPTHLVTCSSSCLVEEPPTPATARLAELH
jgi:putative transposase